MIAGKISIINESGHKWIKCTLTVPNRNQGKKIVVGFGSERTNAINDAFRQII